MKIVFDIQRFFKVFVNDFRVNYMKKLLFLGGLLVLTALFLGINRLRKDEIGLETMLLLLIFVFWMGQGMYTCMVFGEFTSKKKTQAMLLLPVGHAEIFWSRFLQGFIVFPLVYLCYAWLAGETCIAYNHYICDLKGSAFSADDYSWNRAFRTVFAVEELKYVIISFTLLISTGFLWGAMTFKKYAFLKALVSWCLMAFSFWYASVIIYFLISGVYSTQMIPFIVAKENGVVFAVIEFYPYLFWFVASFVCLSLLVISRIKYNEKTI